MRIERINIYNTTLPFAGDFSISHSKWFSSNNIVVETIADQGTVIGYGEGAPREYETGRSLDTITEKAIENVISFANKSLFPWEFNEVIEIFKFIDSLPEGREFNAAICALETSLIDLFGKYQNKYALDYFQDDFRVDSINYGATIPLVDKPRLMEICRLVKKWGVNHLRIKMGKFFNQNKQAIDTVCQFFGKNCELRIDPNSLWDRDLAFKHIPLIEDYNVKIVEEPMSPSNPALVEFADVMDTMGVILMACHSAPTLKDVIRVREKGVCKMLNVKLSRSGGFRRALEIINYLRKNGLYFQIGCHLGESGLLSSAGRILCLLCGDAMYYDGSYDRFILKENITYDDVGFGKNAKAEPLNTPGMGVVVNKESLLKKSYGCFSILNRR